MIRSQPLVSLCFWTVYFTNAPLSPSLPPSPPLFLSLMNLNGYRRLQLGMSFPPGRLCSDNNVAGQAQVKQFLLGQGHIKKNRMFCCISKWFPFLSLGQKHKERFFSKTRYEDLVGTTNENIVPSMTGPTWRC